MWIVLIVFLSCVFPWKLFLIGLERFSRKFFSIFSFFENMKTFKSPQLFFRDFPGQTVFYTRRRKGRSFRKRMFRSFALLCSMKNHPFLLKKWFWIKIYGFWNFFWLKMERKSRKIRSKVHIGCFIVELKN